MVAAEHKPGIACTYLTCGKSAGFAVRATATTRWFGACGYHIGRVCREHDHGNGVKVDVLGGPA